jgi:hypothetical protein
MENASSKASVSPNTWVRAEHGDEIRPSSVRRIADALGVEPDQLMEEVALAGKVEAPSSPFEMPEKEWRLADIDAAERLLEWLRSHEANREELQKARRALRRMAAAIEEMADLDYGAATLDYGAATLDYGAATLDYGAATLDYVEQMDKLSTSIGEVLYGSFGLMAGFEDLSKNDAELAELHETTQARFWELRATVDAAWKPAMDKHFGREDTRKRADVTDINTKEHQHTDREQRLKELKDAVG